MRKYLGFVGPLCLSILLFAGVQPAKADGCAFRYNPSTGEVLDSWCPPDPLPKDVYVCVDGLGNVADAAFGPLDGPLEMVCNPNETLQDMPLSSPKLDQWRDTLLQEWKTLTHGS